MIATTLLPPRSERLPRDAAGRMFAACMADYEALKTLDGRLTPLTEDPEDNRRARDLRDAWGQWADEAQAVLDRIEGDRSVHPLDRQKLAGLIGHGRAVARADVAELRRRYHAAQDGDYVTSEEARRELGLPPRR